MVRDKDEMTEADVNYLLLNWTLPESAPALPEVQRLLIKLVNEYRLIKERLDDLEALATLDSKKS